MSFRVECSEDVVNLRHMMKDHPDMQNIIYWNEVVAIHLSSIEANKMTVSALNLAFKYGHIKSLNLRNKNISDAGAAALPQALNHNSTLEVLDLSYNNISDAGAVTLAHVLYHNSTLKKLDLSYNNISDAGAVAIAQALRHNSTQERLNMSGNRDIGKEGTHQLVQALTVNISIYKATSFSVGGLRLPWRCKKYATQCTQYDKVKDRIEFC